MRAFSPEKSRPFLASIAAGLLIQVSSTLAMQDQSSPTVSAANITSPTQEDPSTWHIEFPGGTVEEYVQLLRETAPKSVYPVINIVIAESTAGFRLPAIDATAELDGFLGCIEACSTSRYQVEVGTDDRHPGSITIIRVIGMEAPPSSRVYNVGHIIRSIPEPDLVSAVSLALEFADSSDGVEMKLHKETGLLFAKGQVSGLDAIEATVKELERGLFGEHGASPGNSGFQPSQPRASQPILPGLDGRAPGDGKPK